MVLEPERIQRLNAHRKRLRIWDRPPQPLLFVDVWGLNPLTKRSDLHNHLQRLGIQAKPYLHCDWRGGCEQEPDQRTGGTAFLVFETTQDAARACKVLQSSSLLGNTLEAELSVNATLKEEYKESEGTDSAAQEGPTEWRSDREALDKDKPLPDWSAGATSVQSSWTPRRGSVFEAVQRMEARRGSEGVMWLRISPISRLASRQDIALLVDKVLRSERSELSDSAIKWFCLNPKKSEVEVPRASFMNSIYSRASRSSSPGDADDVWMAAGGFDRQIQKRRTVDEEDPNVQAGMKDELALLCVDPCVDSSFRRLPYAVIALSSREQGLRLKQLGKETSLQVDEILRLSEFNEHQLSSFHELDDSCIHISRVPNIVNDEEMQCLLRNYNVVKGTLRRGRVVRHDAMKQESCWVAQLESEQEAKRAARELHRGQMSVAPLMAGDRTAIQDPRYGQIVVLPMQ